MELDLQQLGGHTHECGHCRPFWRALRDGSLDESAPAIERGIDCRQCGRPLVVVFADGAHRCVECGIPDFQSEDHVTQLWWSEDPSARALSTGWGGSDIWACSCGERDESGVPTGERWAKDHAEQNSGSFLPPVTQRQPQEP